MAGTLFGLPFSQFNDANGRPQVGAKLYIYGAGTQTPADAFKDFGLTAGQEHPFPITVDSLGRLPQFWLDDGSYSFRVVDRNGINIIGYTTTTALGPSTGDGGGGAAISSEVLIQTGDFIWNMATGVRSGFVRANGRTIGSASSGALERAAADTEALFTYLYTNLSDTYATVSGGRGASAAADFAANKTLTLPDLRGRSLFGLDDMGNSAASRLDASVIASGAATTVGSYGGTDLVTLLQANLPSVTLTTTIAAGQGSHVHVQRYNVNAGGNAGPTGNGSSDAASSLSTSAATLPAMSGTTPLGGSATPISKMAPFVLGTYYVKL